MHDDLMFDQLTLWKRLGLTPDQVAAIPEWLRAFMRELWAS